MEIGSEFWNDFKSYNIDDDLKVPKWFQLGEDYKLLLSGRTALDFIIKDMKLRKNIKLAYLPSYCCDSMVKPFLENDINVDFYDVKYGKQGGFEYDIDYNKCPDVFLAMNYYGFTKSEMKLDMIAFKNKKTLIIEDITHSIFNADKSYADYGIASIRKWMPIPSGAIAINYIDNFKKYYTNLKENNKYINLKLNAMKLKSEYIEFGKKDLKPIFLDEFNKSNKLLALEYKGIKIDDISLNMLSNININELTTIRKQNTQYIYTNLNETNNLKFIYPYKCNDICPLFVPIRVNEKKRDLLKKYLTSKNIYSPVHWNYYPENYDSKKLIEINQSILSLVCDQRYGEKEMEYLVSTINEFSKFD